MATPLVSVVIPCYNGAVVLERAVRSIANQNASSEIIIVDDGSTDASHEVGKRLAAQVTLPVLLVTQPNWGPATARNTGLRLARGRYVCFLDTDDEYLPNFFREALQAMNEDGTIGSVECAVELANLHRPVEHWQLELIEKNLPGNLIVRTEIARRVCGFPEDRAFRGKAAGEDSVFRVEVRKAAKTARLTQPFFRHAVTRGSHFDFFMDRTRWKPDGPVEYGNLTAEEQDGSLVAATNRHLMNVAEMRIEKVLDLFNNCLPALGVYLRISNSLVNVQGYLQPLEGFALYSFARLWPVPGMVAELGSFKGLSTCWIALGCKDGGRAKVAAVDHFRASPRRGAPCDLLRHALSRDHQEHDTHADRDIVKTDSVLPVFRQNLQNMAVADFVEICVGDSTMIASSWKAPLYMLFMDADHSYEATRSDFEAWAPFVLPRGVIVFHDVNVEPGVTQFYHEVLANTTNYRQILMIQSLGVIQKL